MPQTLDTVLLLALPASGKSEVRRYLAQLSPEECGRDFHMGPTVQLDDFPYVHLMRRIDDELELLGKPRVFFRSPNEPFLDTKDWGTLIKLIDEDHADLLTRRRVETSGAAALLMNRIDDAGLRVGLPRRLAVLDPLVRQVVAEKIEAEAREMLNDKHANYPDTLSGKTLVIEFARGGPQGSSFPLPREYGYRYSLAQLSPAILERAVILYVWVTPEESRRKNEARTDPNDPGSILHHGVPLAVMLGDYGCDDMDHLEQVSEKPGTVTVVAHGRKYHLPVARFDNRVDKTSFIRNDPAAWSPEEVRAVHQGLKGALDKLALAVFGAPAPAPQPAPRPKAQPKARKPAKKVKVKKPVKKVKARKPVKKVKARKPVKKVKARKPAKKVKVKTPVKKVKVKKPVKKVKAKKPVKKVKARKPVKKVKVKTPVKKVKVKTPVKKVKARKPVKKAARKPARKMKSKKKSR
jgi:hypothetical protein